MIIFRLKKFSRDRENLTFYHDFLKFENNILKTFNVYDNPPKPLLLEKSEKWRFGFYYLGFLDNLNLHLLYKDGKFYDIHQPLQWLRDVNNQVASEKPVLRDDKWEELVSPYIQTYTNDLRIDLLQKLKSSREKDLQKSGLPRKAVQSLYQAELKFLKEY